jgi:hypothetical protein
VPFKLRLPQSQRALTAISIGLLTLLIAMVCLRSWVFMVYPHSHLDSDQAVFGLMAKDISLGRAFPLFMYGQRYMLAVGSWLCAPLFALFGPNIFTLKLPMFVMNLACIGMLWHGLRREAWLGPWGTAVTILPFAAASVVTSSRLVEHQGGNVEPIFFMLLAFTLRRHAIGLGVTLGFAFLNREFSLIGLFALLIMDVASGNLKPRLKLYGIAFVVGAVVVALIRYLATFTPGYIGQGAIFQIQNPFSGQGFAGLFGIQLPNLIGAAQLDLRSFNITSNLKGGHDWFVWLMVVWAALAVAGATQLKRHQLDGLSTYLVLVGFGQAAAFVLLCAAPDNGMLVRYILVCFCGFLGFTALAWRWEPLRGPIAAVVLIISVANLRDHIRLVREYVRQPPRHHNEELADALLENGVRYAVGNFWVAYDVTWLTNEEIIISPPHGQADRIGRYHDDLRSHPEEVVEITEKRCKRGKQLLNYYLCKVPARKL